MRTSASAALAVIAVLAFAACSADPQPKFEPTPSSTTTSSSPSPTQQPQSAEDFIREWVALQTEMQNTGETDAFLEASNGCRACKKVAALVESFYKAGGFVRTRGWRPVGFQCEHTGKRVSCDVRMTSAPTTYKRSSDARIQHLEGGRFLEIFELTKPEQGWNVSLIAERAT